MHQLDLLVGTDDEDVADGLVVGRGPPFGRDPGVEAGSMPYSLEIVRSVSPIIG